ncbi:helix-turn-helix transcriptional regulator [Phenylobacterium sp.]|uniref:helix-turn-helix domain-containing protein n=1 Tax=Phenylobacterium sp. TaxID=1871053 RepID=UPI002CF92E68|nr:helix-turn-helix transcriptional regulator [Phenylobacterium sp.]HLZ77152.1 helix-turn-helix transcriptional regulator [Phenylobacterium sp.]
MARAARPSTESFHSAEYERFAKRLRTARENAGLTQAQVAEAIGKDRTYVVKYEGRNRRLDVIEFLRIAQALGLDVAQFLADLQAGREGL